MAIVFPRAMPLTGVGRQHFEIDRADYLSRTNSGRLSSMTAGFPLWRAEWQLSETMGASQSDEWRAFISSLDGPSQLFYGRDFERPYPRAYANGFGGLTRAAGGAFDGSATDWSEAITADSQSLLTLEGLPAGFLIGHGDYVGFRWVTAGEQRRSMVRSVEVAMANGSGVATFAVKPGVPLVTPPTAVAYLNEPVCLMRMDPSQTTITGMNRRRCAGAQVVALQDLLP